jgi:hypothetical protein
MSNLAYLGLAVGLSVIGLFVLWLVRRRPHSMEAGMEAFNRELQALAPPDAQVKRQETHVDQVSPPPIRPRPTGPQPARRTGPRRSRGTSSDGASRRRRDPPGVEPD